MPPTPPTRRIHSVALVRTALREVPRLLHEPGWRTFWDAAQSLPLTDRAGFLATRRDFLRETQSSVAYEGTALRRLPEPLNTPFGCTAMSAFLTLAKWEYAKQARDRIAAHPLTGGAGHTAASRRETEKFDALVQHPRIIDSVADVFGWSGVVGSLADSVRAFHRLTALRAGDPRYDFIFEHPAFIWTESINADAQIRAWDAPHRGKWVCCVNTLDTAVDVTERLLPDFCAGRLASAKFDVTSAFGGFYYILYSPDADFARKGILEAAARRSAFFVYDSDCHEAAALAAVLAMMTPQLTPSDVQGLPEKRQRLMAQLRDARFGANLGISDVQRRLMSAIFAMEPQTDPHERFVFLAHGYFSRWKDTLTAHLPKLLAPENAMMVSMLLTMQRALSV